MYFFKKKKKRVARSLFDDIFSAVRTELRLPEKNAIARCSCRKNLYIVKVINFITCYMSMKIKGRCLKRESIWKREPNLPRWLAPITTKTKLSLNVIPCYQTRSTLKRFLYLYLVYNQDNVNIIQRVFSRWSKQTLVPFNAPPICRVFYCSFNA